MYVLLTVTHSRVLYNLHSQADNCIYSLLITVHYSYIACKSVRNVDVSGRDTYDRNENCKIIILVHMISQIKENERKKEVLRDMKNFKSVT